jgi:cobalt-zinc-cadmium resistance protein CzcA
MAAIPGMHDVKLLRDFGQPNLDIDDRPQDAAARFGINVADIQDAVQTAVGGNAVSQVLIGEQRYDVTVRYQGQYRNTAAGDQQHSPAFSPGERVSLAQLCTVQVKDGAYDIYREGNQRYIAITFNVRGRDLGSTVEDAIKQINDKVKLPRGYRVDWSGEYESEKRAEARLALIVPITILVIFIILFTMFRSYKWSLLILLNVGMAPHRRPAGAAGYGNLPQRVFGVGMLALFGVSVQTGRHHGRIHQPAASAGHEYRRCRG